MIDCLATAPHSTRPPRAGRTWPRRRQPWGAARGDAGRAGDGEHPTRHRATPQSPPSPPGNTWRWARPRRWWSWCLAA